MVTKRTPYMLCMSLLMLSTLAYQSNAMQDMPLITATQCWAACKKISKITAAVGICYGLIRTILDNGISHTDTTAYPSTAQNLSVITDGKVTIRKSRDNKTHVTHCYSALWGSHLPGLHFSENFDGKKLEVHGHTAPTRRPFLAKILEFLFYLKPKKTIHHIIEVPDSLPVSEKSAKRVPYSINIDITTTKKSLHRRNFFVTIDSLVNAMVIYAYNGGVKIACPKKFAQLPIVRTHPPARAPQQPAAIEIHTPDKVVVENFPGDLRISDDGQQFPPHQQQIDLTRHSQNPNGRVFINGSEQPFSRHYCSQQRAQASQHAAVTTVVP